jgi:putative holliday junction resolvase
VIVAGILALDVGGHHTGVALVDDRVGFPMPLDTIEHASAEELLERVLTIVRERGVAEIVVGLPLLPSGARGSQADTVVAFAETLRAEGLSVVLRDERYTTPKRAKSDDHATVACALLEDHKSNVDKA